MALNPQADPWSPVIQKLPHIVYHHHQPLFTHPPLSHFHYPMQLYNINLAHTMFQYPKTVYYSVPNVGFEKMSAQQQVHSIWDLKKVEKIERIFESHEAKPPRFRIFESHEAKPPRFRILESHEAKPPRFRTFTASSTVTQVWKKKAVAKEDIGGSEAVVKEDLGGSEGVVKEDLGGSEGVEDVVDFGNDEGKTSVMIRNIPNKFRREELLKFLDYYSVQNHMEYDFFYLPMDFLRHNNYGYAFVNFTTSSAAAKMMSILDGLMWNDEQSPLHLKTSKKVCEMNWARIQGKRELVDHFQQSKFSCVQSEYLPVVFSPPRNGTTSLSSPFTVGKLGGNPQQKRGYQGQKMGATCLPL